MNILYSHPIVTIFRDVSSDVNPFSVEMPNISEAAMAEGLSSALPIDVTSESVDLFIECGDPCLLLDFVEPRNYSILQDKIPFFSKSQSMIYPQYVLACTNIDI